MKHRKLISKLNLGISRLRWFQLLTLLFVALLGTRLLFSPPAFSQEPITLNLLTFAFEVPTWKPLVQQFEAEHPEIRIHLVEGPNSPDTLENMYTSAFLLGDSPYDLVEMDGIWTAKFAAAGWLMDLTDRLSEAEQSAFFPSALDGGRFENRLYRLPYRNEPGLLYYRKDLLEQAGLEPPETTEELVRIAQTLQKVQKTRWGYVWPGRQFEGTAAMFVELLQCFGGFWLDPNTQSVGLDRPEAIAALQFLRQTITAEISPPGVTSYQEEESRRLFQAGEAVFMRNWPYAWSLMNAADSPIQGKFAVKPMVHAPGAASGAALGGLGLGVASTTKHPEAAWQAVQFLTSPTTQPYFSLKGGSPPGRQDVLSDPQLIDQYPLFADLLPIMAKGVNRPATPQYAQASDILQRYISAAITGKLAPKAAMTAAAHETRQLLNSSG